MTPPNSSNVQDQQEKDAQYCEDENDERSYMNWNVMFHMLANFQATHGHCDISIRDKSNDGCKHPKLGQWIKRQRYQRKLFQRGSPSSLNRDRIKQLDSIGFTWSMHDAKWEEKFQELASSVRLHGHCNMAWLDSTNGSLYNWAKRQRRQYHAGKMSSCRVERLESLGFRW